MSSKDSCLGKRQTYPPTIPSVNHFDRKGSELFWIEQDFGTKKEHFGLKCSLLDYRLDYQSSPTWSWRMDLATFKKWSAIRSVSDANS